MTRWNDSGRLATVVLVSFAVLVSPVLPIGSHPTTLQEPVPPQPLAPTATPTPAPVSEQPPPSPPPPVVYAYLITPYQDEDQKISRSKAYDLAEKFVEKFRDQLKQEPTIVVEPIDEEYGSVKECRLANRCEVITLYEESEPKGPEVVQLRIKLKNRVLPKSGETHPGMEPRGPWSCDANEKTITAKDCQLWSLDTFARRLRDHNKTWHKEGAP